MAGSAVTNSHLKPPSSLLYKPFLVASTIAYTRDGMLSAKANPTRPKFPAGKPSSFPNFFQFFPPSTVRYMPLPPPPLVKLQGVLLCCHMLAISLFGLEGSITNSAQPLVSFVYKTRFHVSPPSTVLYTPRSGCSA